MQLDGKLAIVTGGGQGIGLGIVERFVQEGAQVAILQRSALDATVSALPGVHWVQADLGDAAAIKPAVERAVEKLGGLDIVVNNAGIMFEREVEDITVAEWDLMMAVNVRAPMFLVQAAIPHMRARGGGAIVNIGSIEGIGANSQHTAYSASKAAVHGLTRAQAIDLGKYGIRSNAIAPGWIGSDLSDKYLDSMPDPAAARARLATLHPVGRSGFPVDIGDVAVFLAGDHANFVSGETLVVDGGRTIRLSSPA